MCANKVDPALAAPNALLERLKMQSDQTLVGLALSSKEGDDQATRILTRYILEQQKQPVPPREEFAMRGIKTFADRFNLLVKYARPDDDNPAPQHLRETFGEAALLTLEIADAAAGQYVVASTDAHHFAATARDDGGYDIATRSLVYAPPEIHFATLLMNPVNPLWSSKDSYLEMPETPLVPGRMEAQAKVIAEETGLNPLRLLRGAAANAMHIAAWRYDAEVKGEELHPSQMGMAYFTDVADAALSCRLK